MYYFLRINYSPDITGQDVGVGAAELAGRAVNLGIFLQLNLPRTAAKSNTVINRTLSTKVSSWSIQRRLAPFLYPAGSQRNVIRRPKNRK